MQVYTDIKRVLTCGYGSPWKDILVEPPDVSIEEWEKFRKSRKINVTAVTSKV